MKKINEKKLFFKKSIVIVLNDTVKKNVNGGGDANENNPFDPQRTISKNYFGCTTKTQSL